MQHLRLLYRIGKAQLAATRDVIHDRFFIEPIPAAPKNEKRASACGDRSVFAETRRALD